MILRRIARPMLGATFVFGGINALRYHEQHAQTAEPLLERTVHKQSERLPDSTPTDAESLVRIDAAVKIAAGTALALGLFPRVSAALLFGSLMPTTAAGHPFWEEDDPAARQQQLTHFLKNAGLAGGLLLAVADTEGKPSLGWRTRQTVRTTSQQVSDAGRTAAEGVRSAGGNARSAGANARKAGAKLGTGGGGVRDARRASAHRVEQARRQARQAQSAAARRKRQAGRVVRSCG